MKIQFKSIKINISLTEIFLIVSLISGGANNAIIDGGLPHNVVKNDSPRGD